MKQLFTILLLLFSLHTIGQNTNPPYGAGSTTTNNLFNGVLTAKVGIRTGNDTSKVRQFWNSFPQPYVFDTGTIVIQGGSIFWWDGSAWETPSGGGGSVGNLQQVSTNGNTTTLGIKAANFTATGGGRNSYLNLTYNSQFPQIPAGNTANLCLGSMGSLTMEYSDGVKINIHRDLIISGPVDDTISPIGGILLTSHDTTGGDGYIPVLTTLYYLVLHYQPLLGYTAENAANKAVNFNTINNTLYPTTAAVNALLNTTIAAYMPTSDSNLYGTGYVSLAYYYTHLQTYTNGYGINLTGSAFSADTTKVVAYTDTMKNFGIVTWCRLTQQNYISRAALSASSPLAYNSITGAFSIQAANTSQGGYLSAADWNIFNNKRTGLTPTALITTNYSANPNELVGCDNTLGSVTVLLPNAPADGTQVAVKDIIQANPNVITVGTQGIDVINKVGGSTSVSFSLSGECDGLQYQASTHIWFIVWNDLPLSGVYTNITGPVTINNAGVSAIGTGQVTNAMLTNSVVTVNGTTIGLGASGTVTAASGTLTGPSLNPSVTSSALTSVSIITSGTWQGTKVAELYGGTNQSSYALGDMLYASATNTLSKLAGNSTSSKLFLTQTGTGSVSAAPAWAGIASGDLPLTIASNTTGTATLGINLTNNSRITYTSTVTGFSSTTSSTIQYDTIGNKVFMTFSITGTSSSTSFSCTLPILPSISQGGTLPLVNAGALLNGQIQLTAGSNIANFGGTTGSLTAFTASGTKSCININFWYYKNLSFLFGLLIFINFKNKRYEHDFTEFFHQQ